MPFSGLSTAQRDVMRELRERICLSDPFGETVFRETELSKEFGMSRTPIRQVLQSLAYALMVQTRVGYGTTVIPLDRSHRDLDVQAYSSIANACAECAEDEPIDTDLVVELASLQTLLFVNEDRSPEHFVHITAKLIHVMQRVVRDRILSNALENAHWRVLRWRVIDVREDPNTHWAKLENGLMVAVDAAKSRNAKTLLSAASGLSIRHKMATRHSMDMG